MLLRMRWFVVGALSSFGVLAYLANQLRRARERMTPRGIANTSLKGVAKVFDTAAEAVRPDAERR